MDTVYDELCTFRWRRWHRALFPAVVCAPAVGLRTRGSSGHGALYWHFFTELAAYRSLSPASLPTYDRRSRRRMLARERRAIRALAERIRHCGDRVWWSVRRDGTGLEILIAGESWSPIGLRPKGGRDPVTEPSQRQ